MNILFILHYQHTFHIILSTYFSNKVLRKQEKITKGRNYYEGIKRDGEDYAKYVNRDTKKEKEAQKNENIKNNIFG